MQVKAAKTLGYGLFALISTVGVFYIVSYLFPTETGLRAVIVVAWIICLVGIPFVARQASKKSQGRQ